MKTYDPPCEHLLENDDQLRGICPQCERGSAYSFGEDEGGHPYIHCHTCGLKSYNPNDIRERYCGNCHKFLTIP